MSENEFNNTMLRAREASGTENVMAVAMEIKNHNVNIDTLDDSEVNSILACFYLAAKT